jgi:hypothetical protein
LRAYEIWPRDLNLPLQLFDLYTMQRSACYCSYTHKHSHTHDILVSHSTQNTAWRTLLLSCISTSNC